MRLRDLDPFSLSRQLAASAQAYFSFRRGLPQQRAVIDPFLGREFPGRTHFRFVQDLPEGDPLRSSLLKWTHFLVDARVQIPWESQDADLLHRTPHGIREPREGTYSLSEMSLAAVDGGVGAPAKWWRTRARFETALSDHRREVFRRREEVAERLGVSDFSEVFNPLEAAADVESLATRVLEETRDAAESLIEAGWTGFVEGGLARSASEGWPARLAPDTLRGLIGDTRLFRGANVNPGPLPQRMNPMSFVRAAARVGRATQRALVSDEVPWVMAHDPHDLPGWRFGELLGIWTTSGPFLKKKLGLSPPLVREARRLLLPARLCHLRLLAARALCRQAARDRQLGEKWPRITYQLCREELPPSAALARFDVPLESPAQLVAHLGALAWEQELMEAHDEDWYQNPRAQDEMREIARRPALPALALSVCEAGLLGFKKALRQ